MESNKPKKIWWVPLLIKILAVMIGLPILIGGLIATCSPTPEERAAQVKLESQEAEAKLDAMVADGTLYLPKNQAKLIPYIKQGAAQLLASGKCNIIEGAALSEKSTAKDPLFYYHCGHAGESNYGTFKLKVSEIKAGSLKIIPPPSAESSYEACEQFVRSRLNFPSTFNSNMFKKATRTFSDGRRDVTLDFTAKNGFGLELPESARCLFSPKQDGEGYDMEGTLNTQ